MVEEDRESVDLECNVASNEMTDSLQPAGPVGTAPMPRPGGRWRPGESGNISGRPKGLVAAVQEKAGKDGKKLVDGLWLLAYGTPEAREQHFGEPVRVNTKERLLAIGELLDRGWGRPAALLGVETGPSLLGLLMEVTARPAPGSDEATE